MRTIRILLGASFLFFCTTLMHAGHMGMQDPSICSNDIAPGIPIPGAQEVDGTSFSFSANANGTSTNTGSPNLQFLCFLNGSGSTWNNILVTVEPGSPVVAASSVFCDSPTNAFGTAFTCQVNSDAEGDLTSIFFFAGPGQTGIPAFANLFIDLNPCGVAGEVCSNNGEAGTTRWLPNFGFNASINVPEPTTLALLGTGLLVTFRRRLLKSRG
jgi:PEP-CTERM motif